MNAAQRSFLDLLSDDIISVIVRHTSTRPFADDWQEYVDTKVLLCLLKCEGRIGYWARDAISRLQHVEVDVWTRDNPSLEQLIPHLHNVRYVHRGEKEIPQPLFHMPNLRKLYLVETGNYGGFPFDVVLSACGATLVTLSLYSRSTVESKKVSSITRECHQLKELNLRAYEFYGRELEPLWPAIGKTLTKLTLKTLHKGFYNSAEILMPIARNCVVLEDVELNHWQHVWLYKQLGTQLKIIRLGRHIRALSVQGVSDVLVLCPNAMVHGWVSALSDDAFIQLSSRICSCPELRVVEPFPEMPNLREAQFTTTKSCFGRPIPSLRKLTLVVRSDIVFGNVAKSVTNLEELQVIFKSFDVAGAFGENDFVELLYANPRLCKLRIFFYDEELTCHEKVERFIVAIL